MKERDLALTFPIASLTDWWWEEGRCNTKKFLTRGRVKHLGLGAKGEGKRPERNLDSQEKRRCLPRSTRILVGRWHPATSILAK